MGLCKLRQQGGGKSWLVESVESGVQVDLELGVCADMPGSQSNPRLSGKGKIDGLKRIKNVGVYRYDYLGLSAGTAHTERREGACESRNQQGLDSECLCHGTAMARTGPAIGDECVLRWVHATRCCQAANCPSGSLGGHLREAFGGGLDR